MTHKQISIAGITVANDQPFVLFGGLNVLESRDLALSVAERFAEVTQRLGIPYVFKAIDIVLDGANPDKIDEAMVRYGMPMGPIELADQIGLDVCHDAGMVLGISAASEAHLKGLMAAGTIGRKSGSGFYEWDEKKARRPRASYDDAELTAIAHDLLAPLIKECQDAVAEGVVDSADMADAACLFGVGYPAHTGGPLFWHECQQS